MLRRATVEDIPELVELQALLFADMGHDNASTTSWRNPAADWLRDHLGVDACVYVVDDAGTLVACALGYLHTAPPSPSSMTDLRGHISNVVTIESHRRRGHARRCVDALMEWFTQETSAEVVDLSASPDGQPLYESMGWQVRDDPTMRRSISSR
ncbi:MAG: GNAT family N-acetyltransferase [Propionibacteriaceae bacterium]|nr:GNAT family N-acetyltransferase [Propionibacteriaceae bacterium]